MRLFARKICAVILLVACGIFKQPDAYALCDQAQLKKQIQTMAAIAENHAQRIVAEITADEDQAAMATRIAAASASLPEFSTKLRMSVLSRKHLAPIDHDEEARNLFNDLKLGNFEDFYMLVIDIVKFRLQDETCCIEVSRWLANALVQAKLKSNSPDSGAPAECVGGFELAKGSIIMYEQPFSYVFRYGYCEQEDQVWAYDGAAGWHPASAEEQNRICTAGTLRGPFCN